MFSKPCLGRRATLCACGAIFAPQVTTPWHGTPPAAAAPFLSAAWSAPSPTAATWLLSGSTYG